MKIAVTTESGDYYQFDVDPNETVENLKALIEVESKIPHAQQRLFFNNNEIKNQQTLAQCNVRDNDLLLVRKQYVPPPQQQQGRPVGVDGFSGALSGGQPQLDAFGQPLPGLAGMPQQLQQLLQSNPQLIQMLAQQNPQLAQQILTGDPRAIQALSTLLQRYQAELAERQRLARLAADPFSPEAQAALEEEIRRQNVQENMEAAIEYAPESFARVVMLYVDCAVNGVPLKAFVDSGAQTTIMSKECAARCGIMRLIDTRFQGVAKGVGTAKILGRIHLTQMKIGNTFFPVSITVLDNSDMEFLFGLDMLRRHQCCIDLKENCLKIGDEKVPFLGEGDLPKHLRGHEEEEFPSPGGGTQPAVDILPPVPGTHHGTTTTTTTGSTPTITTTTAAPRPAVATPAVDESKVSQLMALGFTREQCIQALQLTGGNPELAAGYLFDNMM